MEFSPQEIKIAVASYGNADKKSVWKMLKLILKKVEEALIKSKGSAPAKNEINEIMDKKTAKDSNLKPLAPASYGRGPDRSVMTKI